MLLGDVFGDFGEDYTVFIGNVLQLAEQLKYLDSSYQMRHGEISEMSDPAWLGSYRNYVESYMATKLYPSLYNNEKSVIDSLQYEATQPDNPGVVNQPVDFNGQYETYESNTNNIHYEESGNGESGQFQPTNYPSTNSVSMNSMLNDHQPTYSPAYDEQTYSHPPNLDSHENHIENQSPPMFMNPAMINSYNAQPPPSPETSEGAGGASRGGSMQPSPVHSIPPTYPGSMPEPPRASQSSPNYFSRDNFQSEISSNDTVRKVLDIKTIKSLQQIYTK